MPIDVDEAILYLTSHLEWDSEPTLTQEQQFRLLEYSKAVDVNGVSPGGDDYVETYTYNSLNVAVLIGARWKLSAAAELHEDDTNEIWEHWNAFVKEWAGKVEGITIGGTLSGSGSFALPNIAVW